MKKLTFDEDLGQLVDEENKNYQGRRFSTVSASNDLSSTGEKAQMDAITSLINIAKMKGADAYEVISLSVYDSSQENADPIPWKAQVRAILYKD